MQDCAGGVCEKLEGTFFRKNCLQCGNIVTYHHHDIITIVIKKILIFNYIRDRGMEEGVVKKYAGKNLDKHSQIETQSFITRDPYCDAKGRQD